MNYQEEQFYRRLVQTIFGSKWFSLPWTFKFRTKAYKRIFSFGEKPIIENDVWIARTHGKLGTIRFGDRVLLARHVNIDYTGEVVLEDDVWMSEGAEIHSHIHLLTMNRIRRNYDEIVTRKVVLKRGCWIGARAIILPQVEEIGEHSVVGAGAVVTKNVPPRVIVAGNPARVIKKLDFDE